MLRGGFKAIHGDLLHIRFREKILFFSLQAWKIECFFALYLLNQTQRRKSAKFHFLEIAEYTE